jgi:hypothetical protein
VSPREPRRGDESAGDWFRPLFPSQRLREAPTGLLVVEEQLPEEQRRQRRADNRRMKEIHSKVRRRKKHGRR